MNQHELEVFIVALANVQRDDSYGYALYFVGADHRVSFVSLATADNEYDRVSNLDREGVYRVNIGVTRRTFAARFGDAPTDEIDYAALNVFMPHPHYAKQNFICILNPAGENAALTKAYIREAHAFAARRTQRGADR